MNIRSLIHKSEIERLEKDPYYIRFYEDPSEEIQLIAVKSFGLTIKLIENPTYNAQLAAVKQNGNAIVHIEDPSEEMEIEAMRQNPMVFRWIKKPKSELVKKMWVIHQLKSK